MSNELKEYLSKYMDLPAEFNDILFERALIRDIPKGTFLLRQGEIPQASYLVLKGCLRSFSLKEGEEKTLEFYLEEEPAVPGNLNEGLPSEMFLEALEDSVVVVAAKDIEQEMMEKYPILKDICLVFSEQMTQKLQEEFRRYKISSPEERYKELIKRRPEVIQRIPQYMIADYLGIKPESLSRIRRRIAVAESSHEDNY